MKTDTHPNYQEMTATCSCGNVIKVGSTLGEDMSLDVCSACHPFYTGKQKTLDAGGRVEKFRRRFGGRAAGAAQVAEAEEASTEESSAAE